MGEQKPSVIPSWRELIEEAAPLEEIISHMRPSLLDLGIAIAAGGAGAYAFTRPNVSSALAGIAIAVALVPPLCTVGIALALGQEASIEVGIIIDDLSARGPFLLFLTNFFGIVFAATLVFFWQYYRRTLAGAFAVIVSFIGLALILRPLDTGTVDLLTHNMVNRSLITESYELLRGKEDIRFTHISTQVRENVVLVRADLVAAPGVINDQFVQELQRSLEKIIEQPVELELGVISENTLYAK
ncbi:DUF389 domain-containing protein [Biformimicrobium ophioploci]|uniref:DUF389 domain-containing protein n=1 Tax=Biformimicrobium ophioploci TaxID=3036711 RepID=A0ABQ6LUL7_9GAMM|nr:DUF389 domain-containing protein [Microbulbifer sp. NKW57]GMG85779.1 hypothetical protein MNKW57_01000 [Microbulbifer sp. NKW57]